MVRQFSHFGAKLHGTEKDHQYEDSSRGTKIFTWQKTR